MKTKQRAFCFDVETSPHLSYHFGLRNIFIKPEQIVDESKVITWAGKFLGERKMYFRSIWDHGKEAMLEDLWLCLEEADVVIGFNSNSFDIKRVDAEFIKDGMQPYSPVQTVDLYRQAAKRFGFTSNRLKHILKDLELSPKLEDNADMKLWIDACLGDTSAQLRMKKYNIQDVRSTEELYYRLLPWMNNLPNAGLFVDDVGDQPTCPHCGSHRVNKHKVRRTKVRVYQQYQCQDCGSYSRGRKAIEVTPGGILV